MPPRDCHRRTSDSVHHGHVFVEQRTQLSVPEFKALARRARTAESRLLDLIDGSQRCVQGLDQPGGHLMVGWNPMGPRGDIFNRLCGANGTGRGLPRAVQRTRMAGMTASATESVRQIATSETALQATTNQITVNLNAWDAILSASLVVQLTLLILVGMSVVSWAILLNKRRFFRQLDEDNESFLAEFWRADSLDLIFASCKDKYQNSSLARIFTSGYVELQKMADAAPPTGPDEQTPLLSGIDNLQRSLQRALESEIITIEHRLSFLATTGSTAPFIGLFGTVWGIMGSFQKIGAMKSASLAVVAPGISEALVATAIGLAAAIPAVMAYNHFIGRLRREEITMNNFSADYLNIVKRNFFRDH